jgi:N-acetylneuraminic acid mutarotase
MIVWGGYDGGNYLNTGGRYNPITDSWTVTSTTNAPSVRGEHTAVWTGSEMIIWGGLFDPISYLNTGGRYNPGTDSWTTTSTTNAPTARYGHTAIWTGSEMIIWGGYDGGDSNTGGRYNPGTDSWITTSTTNAPGGRNSHTAVWTGTEMIIWGGYDGGYNGSFPSIGGRYNPGTDSWTATSTTNAPIGRESHTAVWTGSEMIVWGGWFFDGFNIHILNTGARYNPATNSWAATSTTNAPAPRRFHTAIWTGSEMIIWGGGDFNFNTGGRYNPDTDNWTATSTTNAPTGRSYHTAVWTGSEMIIWGGDDNSGVSNTGGKYNPGTDSWTATNTTNAPAARAGHTAVWTGGEMIIWGGFNGSQHVNTGARYSPAMDNWTATTTTNAPEGRIAHAAVWTGNEMIVWGGYNYQDNLFFNTGGRYSPTTDTWIATSTQNAPSPREDSAAVWTGTEMIVWGGYNANFVLNTGGRYCAQAQAPMAQSAFSRKIHGAAGTFDIPLPLTSNVGVECRSGGATNDYQMIINFATTVTADSASVTSGTGSVSSFSGSGTSQITANLTGITNVQRITVTLFNVNDGTHMGNVPVSMGILVGDVNGNALVNASDVSLTKSQVGQAVSSSNFREDVNANGLINSVDVAQVKSKVGTALP